MFSRIFHIKILLQWKLKYFRIQINLRVMCCSYKKTKSRFLILNEFLFCFKSEFDFEFLSTTRAVYRMPPSTILKACWNKASASSKNVLIHSHAFSQEVNTLHLTVLLTCQRNLTLRYLAFYFFKQLLTRRVSTFILRFLVAVSNYLVHRDFKSVKYLNISFYYETLQSVSTLVTRVWSSDTRLQIHKSRNLRYLYFPSVDCHPSLWDWWSSPPNACIVHLCQVSCCWVETDLLCYTEIYKLISVSITCSQLMII